MKETGTESNRHCLVEYHTLDLFLNHIELVNSLVCFILEEGSADYFFVDRTAEMKLRLLHKVFKIRKFDFLCFLIWVQLLRVCSRCLFGGFYEILVSFLVFPHLGKLG